MQSQGMGGFAWPGLKLAAANLPGLKPLATQGMEIKKKGISYFLGLDPNAAKATAPISNTGLTATSGAGATWVAARSIIGQYSGKYYFEATTADASGGDLGVGICNSNDLMNGYWQGGGNADIRPSGACYINGANQATIPTWVSGSVCIAVDIDNRLVWARTPGGQWLGSGVADPSTGVGGISFASNAHFPIYAAVLLWNGGSPVSVSLNFGKSPFVGIPPRGFSYEG